MYCVDSRSVLFRSNGKFLSRDSKRGHYTLDLLSIDPPTNFTSLGPKITKTYIGGGLDPFLNDKLISLIWSLYEKRIVFFLGPRDPSRPTDMERVFCPKRRNFTEVVYRPRPKTYKWNKMSMNPQLTSHRSTITCVKGQIRVTTSSRISFS